jgi:ABC-type bacteriocin/lantibiotic exporter with double-glycine peptidase domain
MSSIASAHVDRRNSPTTERASTLTVTDPPAATRGSEEWRWLWREVRPFVGYQVSALVLMLLGVAIYALNPLLMRALIDDVLPHRRLDLLVGITLSFLAVYVGSNVLSSIGRTINQLAVLRLASRVRMRLVKHLLALPPSFHAQRPIGDLIRRVEDDVALVGELGAEHVPTITRAAVQGAVTLVTMATLDWRLTCVIVPLVPLYGYVRQHYRTPLRQNAQAVRDTSGHQTSLLNELLAGAMQIQALGAERRLSRRYHRLNLRTMRARWRQHQTEVRFTVANTSIVALGFALIVLYGGSRVITGSLTPGGLVAFYSYLGLIFGPLMMASESYARLGRVRASIARLVEIERVPEPLRDASHAVAVAPHPERVECHEVTFSYLPGRPTLRGVDFIARAGERVVLIGPSGCGKSSLLKLIPRFYDVEQGQVTVDGIDVRDLQMRSLRDAISFVPQEPLLFDGTLRDNLRHGCPTARSEEIDRVLWMTCLTDLIAQLPHGLDTELGRIGGLLSGGERQRLVVARALLQDRPILILDEATSALDPTTEHRVLERLHPWCDHRVVIVVSHRSSAPLWADRVVTFQNGRAVSDDPGQGRRSLGTGDPWLLGGGAL